MRRTILALAIASVSVIALEASAAPPPGGGAPTPLNVNVMNTPNVNVANEVVVRSQDEPARSPYWADRHLTLSDLASNIQMSLETVPSGTRVVLEFVSFYCTTRPGDSLLNVGIGVQGTGPDEVAKTMFYFLPLQKAAADFGGLSRWHATQPIRLYADPGEIRFQATRTGEGDFWACDVALSGYTVAIP